MKTLLFLALMGIPLSGLIAQESAPASEASDPETSAEPAGEERLLDPIEIHNLRLVKQLGKEAAAHLQKGENKEALIAYKQAFSLIKEMGKLKEEYNLYKARYTSLALKLAADSLEAEDENSARKYLNGILAEEVAPDEPVAKALLEVIGADPDPEPIKTGSWSFTAGGNLPSINREWGFVLLTKVKPEILVNGDEVELVRDGEVIANFDVKLPEEGEDTIILSKKEDSAIPAAILKGDVFRLKVDEDEEE